MPRRARALLAAPAAEEPNEADDANDRERGELEAVLERDGSQHRRASVIGVDVDGSRAGWQDRAMALLDRVSLPPDLQVERLEGDVAVVSGSAISGIRRTVLRTTPAEAIALGRELVLAGTLERVEVRPDHRAAA